MPTVSAVVNALPEVGPGGHTVQQWAGSSPWAVMLGDWAGSHRGEAQNDALLAPQLCL